MQKLLALFALLIFFGLPAMAQDIPVQEAPKPEEPKTTPSKKKKPEVPVPKFEFELGYTNRSFAAPTAPRFGMSGWNGDLVYNRYRWLSIVGDSTGTYNGQGVNGRTSIYTLMGGPRVYMLGHRHKLIPYGQFTIGYGGEILKLPLTGGFPATTRSSTGYAYAGGGGIEYRLKKHWAVRVVEFDYEKTHFNDLLFLTGSASEGNYRFSAGFVYRWGQRK